MNSATKVAIVEGKLQPEPVTRRPQVLLAPVQPPGHSYGGAALKPCSGLFVFWVSISLPKF